MSDVQFNDIFRAYERFAAAKAPDWSLAPDVVLRVVAYRWATDLPSSNGPALLELAKQMAGVYVASGNLALCNFKGLCAQRLIPGTEVSYIKPTFWDSLGGSPTRQTLTADEGTWYFDIVINPLQIGEQIVLGNVLGKAFCETWTAYLQAVLSPLGGRGQVEVNLVGWVPLDANYVSDSTVYDNKAYMEAARQYWAAQPGIWQVSRGADAPKGSGLVWQPTVLKINGSGPAWGKYPPYLGAQGTGFSVGSAMEPALLTPYAVSPSFGMPDSTGPTPTPLPDMPEDIPLTMLDVPPANRSLQWGLLAGGVVAGYFVADAICRRTSRF